MNPMSVSSYILKLIIKPTFTSILSLNTDSFEKLYKELEIVLYHGLKTPLSC